MKAKRIKSKAEIFWEEQITKDLEEALILAFPECYPIHFARLRVESLRKQINEIDNETE